MHFFRDSGVSSVLESSFTPRKLRFSALASCVALPPESIQSSGRYFLALTKKLLFLEVPSRDKALSFSVERSGSSYWLQHFLYFLPLPHGHGSLRPALAASRW